MRELTQDEHQFEVLQALSLSNVLVNTPQAIGTCAKFHHRPPHAPFGSFSRTLFTSSKEIAAVSSRNMGGWS